MTGSRIRRWLRWIVGLLVLAILCLVGGALAAGLYLSAPARASVGAPPPGLAADTVTIPSLSGATLRGWFILGRTGGGAVVLVHGVGSNRLSMVARARLLNAAGFSVLLFDLQAHGESSGSRITFGHREALDLRSAVDYLRQRLPGERVGVIGTSLGGAAALLGPAPLAVDALVLESVYSEIGAATANRIRIALGPLLGPLAAEPSARLMQLLLTPILQVQAADLRPIDHISEVAAPVLIASGTRDTRTTIAEAQALFARAPQPKLFWAVEGAGHIDLESFAPAEYRRRVLPFLIEHLQAR
jgi:fermentation-respiration switch protein FrsA (DUF1100 family)